MNFGGREEGGTWEAVTRTDADGRALPSPRPTSKLMRGHSFLDPGTAGVAPDMLPVAAYTASLADVVTLKLCLIVMK